MVALVLADAVTLGELFGVNDRHGHCFESELDAIGNGRLHAIEEEDAAEEDEGDREGGSEKKQVRSVPATSDGPAEAVNDAGHGVETVKPAPASGDEGGRISDGRGEHPELDEKGHDVPDVAVKGVERREPKANTQGGEERK